MALTITQENDTITLEGALNTATLKGFKTHFEFILNSNKGITLDINRVTEIDASAMNTLKAFYRKAILERNIFFVVGKGCKDIYDDFKYINIA